MPKKKSTFLDRFQIVKHGDYFYFQDIRDRRVYLHSNIGVIAFSLKELAQCYAESYPFGSLELVSAKQREHLIDFSI